MTVKEALIAFDKRLTGNILTDPDFVKMRASGRSAAFIASAKSSVFAPNRYTKLALNAFEQDKGRGPTKRKTGGLYQAIYDWLKYQKYGLTWRTERERRGLAFVITRKISREGSAKFRGRVSKTQIFAKAVNKELPKLRKDIALAYSAEIQEIFSIFGKDIKQL